VTSGQRRADALALLAESALAGGLDGGTAGDRYQAVLHVDVDRTPGDSAQGAPDLTRPTGDLWPVSSSGMIECGDRVVDVSAETSARLTCDAAVVVIREDAGGAALDVGRKTRTIPAAIRRALETRDTGCRFPGCTARRCEAHHVVHWADGGPTCLDNLVLLCRRHHRLLHEGGYTMHSGAGRALTFANARGRLIDVAPPAPTWSERASNNPAVSLGAPPTWDGTPFDLGYVIDVLRGGEPVPAAGSA
jgi:hypothetical protein